jgi:hypothetical protein
LSAEHRQTSPYDAERAPRAIQPKTPPLLSLCFNRPRSKAGCIIAFAEKRLLFCLFTIYHTVLFSLHGSTQMFLHSSPRGYAAM